MLLLFLVVPAVEVALLGSVGARLGFWATFGLVVAAAVVGSWLARREGLAVWQRVQARLAAGGVPGPELIDGLIVLVSATLLVAPGFLTDLVGLAGLFPPTRALIRRALVRRFERGLQSGTIRVSGMSGAFGPGPFGAPFGTPTAGVPEATVEDAEVLDDGRPRTPIR